MRGCMWEVVVAAVFTTWSYLAKKVIDLDILTEDVC
jgi:hypothetical protein